ncbi:hypothetical protein DH2020_042711 [Rehmannia glutinosa]|uniref:Uncharacterized protein n=1 Tax=Rehmannia glutinosa TaxID=99300 RepID=A0ABR0ULR4_REHGL
MMKTEGMGRRFNNQHAPNEGRVALISLQRKLVETKRINQSSTNQVPDITDFMNDVFFGTINGGDHNKKTYNLTGGGGVGGRVIGDRDEEYGILIRALGVHRALEGSFSGEILSKTANHTRNRSETNLDPPQPDGSPTSEIQKWISKIPNNPDPPISPDHTPPSPTSHLGGPPLPPRQSTHRRTLSPSTCPCQRWPGLVTAGIWWSRPPRSISSSTCRTDRILQKDGMEDGQLKDGGLNGQDLNGFLREQRVKIGKLLSGEIDGRAKIVLSGPSNSTSSMVAATCYAWLLENKMRANKKEGVRNENNSEFVVPVMNIRRGKMWKQRQAAWLFHHVDLETLMMAKQLSMLVVGEDILKTNGEVGSACTVLTDNYCEDAYDLLQTPILKNLLLAGILLDTQNLSPSRKLSMTRDAEAVQLLSVASAPTIEIRFTISVLVQDQRDNNFFEALCRTYGKPPSEINWKNGAPTERKISSEIIAVSDDKKQNNTNDARTKKVSPISGKPTPSPSRPCKNTAKSNNDASRGKNKNFFAKLFGFGSK